MPSTDDPTWSQVKQRFREAVELDDSQRGQFLAKLEHAQPALASRVRQLLAHDNHTSGALAQPLQLDPDAAAEVLDVCSDDLTPDTIGPYSILAVVGEGGMGIVYRAEQHEPLRRTVALKVIKYGFDTSAVIRRFEGERQALALMDHPSIAKVFDAGETDDGRPYFVMEHVAGLPVTDYCDTHSLSVEERLRLFVEICEAVHSAHQKGVIHRDLKPSNILIEQHGDKAHPKVIDFGIAKSTRTRLTEDTIRTQLGQVIGTPDYMSPEQLEMATDVDTRSDVYSLGILLYQLLVGHRPFDLSAASLTQIQQTVREQDPKRPSTCLSGPGGLTTTVATQRRTELPALIRQLRGDLDWITMTALEKDRERRYGSARELALDIERHLNHEPVIARPPSLGYRFAKLTRRNRPVVVAGCLVVGAALVGVGVFAGGLAVGAVFALSASLVGVAVSTALLRQAQRARRGEVRQREAAERHRQIAEEGRARSDEQRQIAEEMEVLAQARAREAEAAREETQTALAVSEERLSEVLRLSDVKRIDEMEARADELWPALPDKAPGMTEWLDDARVLAERLPLHEESLTRLREGALPYREADAEYDAQTHPNLPQYEASVARQADVASELETVREQLVTSPKEADSPKTLRLEEETGPHVLTEEEWRLKLAALERQHAELAREIEALSGPLGERTTWRFTESEDQWRHDVLHKLVSQLRQFTEPDPRRGTIASVRKRLAFATEIEVRSVSSPEAKAEWKKAATDIRQLPIYDGLEVRAQIGLLPLRRDPRSGLWEFWHIASGARPQPNPDPDAANPWIIEEDTGIVLVLLPGGTFLQGAQSDDPQASNYDPLSLPHEGPPQRVELMPYLLGRYPLTQGQWRAANGVNPSIYNPNGNYGGKQYDLRHPVEFVSWPECNEMLARLNLRLPTEAQWEFGCRAGTTTPWWTGANETSLSGATNLLDGFAVRNGLLNWQGDEWLCTGYVCHSPVGHFRANPFGLHDMHGNVWEWCRDHFGDYAKCDREGPAAELIVPGAHNHVIRGGAFLNRSSGVRSSCRREFAPENRDGTRGARAAMLLS